MIVIENIADSRFRSSTVESYMCLLIRLVLAKRVTVSFYKNIALFLFIGLIFFGFLHKWRRHRVVFYAAPFWQQLHDS